MWLACQLKSVKNLDIVPLISTASSNANTGTQINLSGREVGKVVLFIDLRDFSGMPETKLPSAVVYILNKYFKLSGEAIEDNLGRRDKFMATVSWLFLIFVGITAIIAKMR